MLSLDHFCSLPAKQESRSIAGYNLNRVRDIADIDFYGLRDREHSSIELRRNLAKRIVAPTKYSFGLQSKEAVKS
jgi:SOS response regulatory protein OraA/RecX